MRRARREEDLAQVHEPARQAAHVTLCQTGT
jgi:hypothetical protein